MQPFTENANSALVWRPVLASAVPYLYSLARIKSSSWRIALQLVIKGIGLLRAEAGL